MSITHSKHHYPPLLAAGVSASYSSSTGPHSPGADTDASYGRESWEAEQEEGVGEEEAVSRGAGQPQPPPLTSAAAAAAAPAVTTAAADYIPEEETAAAAAEPSRTGGEVRVHKYPRRATQDSGDSEDDGDGGLFSDAESVGEEEHLQESQQLQQQKGFGTQRAGVVDGGERAQQEREIRDEMEFTFGSALHGSVLSEAVSSYMPEEEEEEEEEEEGMERGGVGGEGLRTSAQAGASTSFCEEVVEEEEAGVSSGLGASNFDASGLSNTLEVGEESGLISGLPAGHYSISFGPMPEAGATAAMMTAGNGGDGTTLVPGQGLAAQPSPCRPSSSSGGGSRPPLHPAAAAAARRATWENPALHTPPRGPLVAVTAAEDAVLFGSPVPTAAAVAAAAAAARGTSTGGSGAAVLVGSPAPTAAAAARGGNTPGGNSNGAVCYANSGLGLQGAPGVPLLAAAAHTPLTVGGTGYVAEPRVVTYEPARYQDSSPEPEDGDDEREEGDAYTSSSPGSSPEGAAPPAAVAALSGSQRSPSPIKWRAGESGPRAQQDPAATPDGLATITLPFMPTSPPPPSSIAATAGGSSSVWATPGGGYAAPSDASVPATPLTGLTHYGAARGLVGGDGTPADTLTPPEQAGASPALMDLSLTQSALRLALAHAHAQRLQLDRQSQDAGVQTELPATLPLAPLQKLTQQGAGSDGSPAAAGAADAAAAPVLEPAAAPLRLPSPEPLAHSPTPAAAAEKLSQLKLRRQQQQQWQQVSSAGQLSREAPLGAQPSQQEVPSGGAGAAERRGGGSPPPPAPEPPEPLVDQPQPSAVSPRPHASSPSSPPHKLGSRHQSSVAGVAAADKRRKSRELHSYSYREGGGYSPLTLDMRPATAGGRGSSGGGGVPGAAAGMSASAAADPGAPAAAAPPRPGSAARSSQNPGAPLAEPSVSASTAAVLPDQGRAALLIPASVAARLPLAGDLALGHGSTGLSSSFAPGELYATTASTTSAGLGGSVEGGRVTGRWVWQPLGPGDSPGGGDSYQQSPPQPSPPQHQLSTTSSGGGGSPYGAAPFSSASPSKRRRTTGVPPLCIPAFSTVLASVCLL